MALGGCGQICKWIVILFNILLILVGMALVAAGVYLQFSAITLEELKTKHFIFMVGLCIAVGVVILITASVGDYGSCSENKSALSVYCSLLVLLAAAAAIGGGVAFVNNKEFSGHVAEFYTTIYTQYLIKGDMIRAFILKLFHNAFDCCGLGGVMQTVIGVTNICPKQSSILGISYSTSSSCLPVITSQLEASTVLTFFMVIAGILIMVVVCAGFIYQQLSRPVVASPPYIPLSPTPLSPSSYTICSTTTSPPAYTTVAEQV
ncbi:CD81 antigen isoform X1 [Ictalurus furcatus]|uniref:CD81 antigen isoform X1 n=1 Tax=Ictalurus furcatus TaxID=66913 RepID=UPI00234FC0FF|nr:CD81 antigen isoform X1 [Ictalurus furcatus]XP_053493802.1 CD81 antigen isoform X1 [Ictalurus furcatus]